jgi:L-seryl-tRNA(Ser) seleniumtransferase
MEHSGASVREVGTTNRTSIDDYRDAVTGRTRLILRVHPSNFRIEGFTARPALRDLVALGREKGIPVYEDLGSGCLVDMRPHGVDEPPAGESLRAGVDLVSFSGDKLLGGPQAGIIAGKPELVSRLRRNAMFRALRLDKLVYQALETTLREILLQRYDRIPVLRMIREPAERVHQRAKILFGRIPGLSAELIPGQSLVGGGSTPGQSLPTWLIAITGPHVSALDARLRSAEPPVVARVEKDRLLLDLRTVQPEEEDDLLAALQALS